MSKINKILEKMRSNPRDWRIEKIESVARQCEVNVRRSGGSHVIFEHPKLAELLSIPAHRPIKSIYIKKFIEFIERLNDEKNT